MHKTADLLEQFGGGDCETILRSLRVHRGCTPSFERRPDGLVVGKALHLRNLPLVLWYDNVVT